MFAQAVAKKPVSGCRYLAELARGTDSREASGLPRPLRERLGEKGRQQACR